jgi:pimeloyl-ACP methyl ester carboxylesterase
LYFELPAGIGLASFEGAFITADSVFGMFQQRGQQFPFHLKKENEPTTSKVDQSASPGNIKEKEIEIALSDGVISGTLTYPNQPGKFPLIVLISGSGLQTRDEEVAGFKVFNEISDYLSRSEYAVFRYDDRGIGNSTIPDPTQSAIQDLADEVIAILDHMRTESVVMPDHTVLLGHSLGGMVALEVSKEISRLKGLVLMATPAYSGKMILLQQIEKNLQLAGKSPAEIDSNLHLQRSIYQALDDSNKLAEVRAKYKQHLVNELQKLPKEKKKAAW